jgi:hypothetical protein
MNDFTHSRSRFLEFLGKKFQEGEGEDELLFYEGDLSKGDLDSGLSSYGEGLCIVRLNDGFLSNQDDGEGGTLPAVEAEDGHTEWWENGFLHREEGPAVITDGGTWEEYWEKGLLERIESGEETAASA